MVAPPPVQLSTIGMWDSMFLMLLALVVFGPRRLPQIGRQIGKLMYEFRKASNDFKFQMEEELRVSEEADRRKKEDEERARNLALSAPAATQTIEAQADIGAVEQASVSAQPAATGYPEASGYPEAVGVSSEDPGAAAETEDRIYPRISPPTTGETVAASRYGANGQLAEAAAGQETGTDAGMTAEANIGAEPAPSAGDSAATNASAATDASAASGSSSDPNRTETVSQHG